MPTTVAKVSISFGLVHIPVRVHSATETHSVGLHQVHAKDGARIRQSRVCEAEGVEVPLHEVARGFESADGRTVVLTPDDLADLPLPSVKAIEVLAFVPRANVDMLALDKPYYLGADTAAAGRPYVLLRDAMQDTDQIAIARVTLRSREQLSILYVRDDVLVLQTLLWPDEVRPRQDIAPTASSPRPQELQMAKSLMAAISEDFNLQEQRDHYREALEKVVDAKLAGTEPPHAPGARVLPSGVVDLMAALEASVEEARVRRDADADAEPAAPAAKPASKKAPAKKTTKRRTAS